MSACCEGAAGEWYVLYWDRDARYADLTSDDDARSPRFGLLRILKRGERALCFEDFVDFNSNEFLLLFLALNTAPLQRMNGTRVCRASHARTLCDFARCRLQVRQP
jgi:hypothetical protein